VAAVVLLVVPALYPALAGLRPLPPPPDAVGGAADTTEGAAAGAVPGPRHELRAPLQNESEAER
jgi:hypothetical protein